MKAIFFSVFLLLLMASCQGTNPDKTSENVQTGYTKMEQMIPMRDGIKLYTAIYIPNETKEQYPFLIMRTPYGCAPYGEKNFRKKLGPSLLFKKEEYIYVYQDVRGRHMSEGDFEEMTPVKEMQKNKNTDESTDAFDTIDWLIKNIKNNNGKAGIYGISYPGFYATASLPNAHPALKAVSPQAPVTDEFVGDDVYHNGAFFLMDNFSFINFFDAPRNTPRAENPAINDSLNIDDVFKFYKQNATLVSYNSRYLKNKSKIWNEYLQHDTYDDYWKARNIRTNLHNIKPATLVVGGWFDAEDMFGALNTYKAIESLNPENKNQLFMGPWTHGAWQDSNWNHFETYDFNGNTSSYFQRRELNFFNYYLKDQGKLNDTEAEIFITGSNQWRSFEKWPPKNIQPSQWYLNNDHRLELSKKSTTGSDTYTSNPSDPVPYINKTSSDRLSEYMAADQTFASKRKDVVTYTSDVLTEAFTLCGSISANLQVSVNSTDADFIVKIIDVLPDDNHTQQLLRAEVLRGKFRNSLEKPTAFTPGKISQVNVRMNDIAHTFLKGHAVMVQIQSSWFPLVDRNPQKFMRIPAASEKDFMTADITILHDDAHPSYINTYQLR